MFTDTHHEAEDTQPLVLRPEADDAQAEVAATQTTARDTQNILDAEGTRTVPIEDIVQPADGENGTTQEVSRVPEADPVVQPVVPAVAASAVENTVAVKAEAPTQEVDESGGTEAATVISQTDSIVENARFWGRKSKPEEEATAPSNQAEAAAPETPPTQAGADGKGGGQPPRPPRPPAGEGDEASDGEEPEKNAEKTPKPDKGAPETAKPTPAIDDQLKLTTQGAVESGRKFTLPKAMAEAGQEQGGRKSGTDKLSEDIVYSYYTKKAEWLHQAEMIAGEGQKIAQSAMRTKKSEELKAIGKMTASADALTGGKGRTAEKLQEVLGEGAGDIKKALDLVDTITDQLLRGAPDKLDVVDALVGAQRFNQACQTIIADQLAANPDLAEREVIIDKQRQMIAEQVMFKLLDKIPIQHSIPLTYGQVEGIAKAAFGEGAALDEKLLARMSDSMFEKTELITLVQPTLELENKEAARKLPGMLRQLTSELAERQREGGQMPTLVVQGADIGLPGMDIIMGHPNSYGPPMQQFNNVVADFFIVDPKEVHRLPVLSREHMQFSVVSADFGEEEGRHNKDMLPLPLRLYKDGSMDFGWPMLSAPHRPIDPVFRAFKAHDGLTYTKCLFAALAADATAPPEVIEVEAPESVPRIIGDAVRQGKSGKELMEIMSTMVIPQRIRVVNRPERSEDEREGTSHGTPKRWHIARAYARRLREGYSQSADNLEHYLWDLEHKLIHPLSPEDDLAIREGRKSYVPPAEKGNRDYGEVVGTRAQIGDGATSRVINLDLPDPDEEDGEQPQR